MSDCRIFISLYNEILEHVIHEAEYYLEILTNLRNRTSTDKALCDELNFWNGIMRKHAQFVDGMLDPTETALKESAKATAVKFERLVETCINTPENIILDSSIISAENIINFKTDVTAGLLRCEIKSIILPLLADHVLREANHYLRILKY